MRTRSFQPRLEVLEDRLTPSTYPLTSVPVLNSLPGATASLYLDFDGDFQAQWGGYSNVTTPAFDTDGDPTTFSDVELAKINQIWQYVAEDYAPFNLNVTTVEPSSFANGVALRVAIGGTGTWFGGGVGGVSFIGSFAGPASNTAFVFSKNLANNPRYIGDAVSHEAGHAFGLQHQQDTIFDDRHPIMAGPSDETRNVWWSGINTLGQPQDDMAVIANATNGFGYRPDDVGNTGATANPLAVSGSQVSGAGIIGTTADLDYFSFSTAAGQITLSVNVPALYNNLDARLELRDATSNALIASSDPSTGYGATITANVAAGSYRLVVASHGLYGDVGQYTITGTIVPDGLAAPTNLTATPASSSAVNLAWDDNATSETGYLVDRSADGVTWSQVASLSASSVSYADSAVAAGLTYSYRVRAANGSINSNPSNQASATLAPTAPSGLTASAASSSQINLAWGNVAGETGFKIERFNGVSWIQIATVGANVTSYQDAGLSASTSYSYRVRAANAGGDSLYSNQAGATTQAALTVPPAPSGLNASTVSASQINLSWNDVAGETGYKINRSTDGVNFTQIATVGAGVITFQNTGLTASTTYHYRVVAVNAAGDSGASNVASATTSTVVPQAPTAPVAPVLTATAISPTQVNLSWTEASLNVTSYLIQRQTNGGKWVTIAQPSGTATSFPDTTVIARKTYKYRIYAINSVGTSPSSNIVQIG